jgi:hypothetical protein
MKNAEKRSHALALSRYLRSSAFICGSFVDPARRLQWAGC